MLDIVAPLAWYVDVDGVTRFGARPAATVVTAAARTRIDPDAGVIVLASESIVSLVPGATIDGVEAIDIRHDLDAGGLRTTLYGAAQGGARRESMRSLVRSLFPELRWAGQFEYRVVQQHGERLDLQPVLSSLGLPDLPLVRIRPGVPGAKALHALGSLVLVAFANRDPARPVVVAFDDADSPGFLPLEAELDASDTVAVGASADMVELGSGSEVPPPADPVGRVIRYGDTIALPPPISADYVLVPGNVPMGVAKVSA